MSDQDSSNPDEPEFIDDGHQVYIVWDKDHIKIANVTCPNKGVTAICNRRRPYCVVQRFVEAQEFDVNVGRTIVKSPVGIAWIPVYGESDLDDEFMQIWVIPTDDPDFLTWKELRDPGGVDPDASEESD